MIGNGTNNIGFSFVSRSSEFVQDAKVKFCLLNVYSVPSNGRTVKRHVAVDARGSATVPAV